MNDSDGVHRRTVLKSAATAGVVSQLGHAGLAAATHALTEHRSVSAALDRGVVRHTLSYDVPAEGDDFGIFVVGLKQFEFRSIERRENFEVQTVERRGVELEKFVWTGDDDPTLVVTDDIQSTAFAELPIYYYDGDHVLVSPVDTLLAGEAELDSSPVSVEGNGVGDEHLLLFGPHQTATRTVDDVDITVVLPDSVDRTVDRQRALDVLGTAGQLIGNSRLTYPERFGFVVPDDAATRERGRAIGSSFLARAETWQHSFQVPAHEYAHTVFGVFGADRMAWLREGIAEYYQHATPLNASVLSVPHFLDGVRVSEEYADVVLTDSETVAKTPADYEKGPHVVAALNVQIQQRTGGEKRLIDLFDLDYTLSEYDQFVAALRELTADPEIETWVDTHVDGPAVPTIPPEPVYHVPQPLFKVAELPRLTPSVRPGTKTLISADIDNIGANPGTETVAFALDGERLETRTLRLEGAQSERVSFEFDASQYDLGEYSYQIQTDTDERTGTVTIGTPATFQLASLDLDPAPLTQGTELSVTAVVRNTGDVAGEQTITARIEEETAARSRVETTVVELAGNDSHTVTLGFNTAGLDPGTYVLTVEVGEATRETEITVEPEGDSEANDSGAGDTGNETDPSADDTGVGFGVVGGLAGASAAGYLVQRRLTAEDSCRTETAGERRK